MVQIHTILGQQFDAARIISVLLDIRFTCRALAAPRIADVPCLIFEEIDAQRRSRTEDVMKGDEIFGVVAVSLPA